MEDNKGEITEEKKKLSGREKTELFMQSVSLRLWILLRLNVMFLVFCIPVLTVPASASAMTKVLMNLVRNDDCSLWSDFWSEFKGSFTKSLIAGLVLAVMMAAVFFAGYMIHISFEGFISSLGLAFIIVFEALIYFAACYLFPLIAAVDISAGQCIKNSFLLAIIEIKRNLLLLLPLALIAACALLYPVTLPLLVFITFSLCQFIVCSLVWEVIKKRIINPFYSEKRQ